MNINAQFDFLREVALQEKTEAMYDELLKETELMKQFEAMSYADELANDDAQYYGA